MCGPPLHSAPLQYPRKDKPLESTFHSESGSKHQKGNKEEEEKEGGRQGRKNKHSQCLVGAG